ncbi:protein of unknown function DUF187 [Caldithrix abyssi DSM 13497]|uniref:Uncharacterized lipoprotein YddW, UPF0748 family n=1 Tax=Caldithrix abyssi DSM 13497 TaxID=880073 RepID=H1XVZ3_CALAY|nr:family 10 glycosylhydrolase [Caldithrix abyssi]APF17681.1 Uncharacterized lipoprotein YddW, UPF0748 family [Caldithrix abyssi DSM 13497]EHO41765.1 protein of unknown function DUF187 [Caldithrix abyssi DSM 13497]
MLKIIVLILGILVGQALAQHRGIWIVRNSLNTKEDLKQLERIHQKLQLTDVYVQVRALGENVYSAPMASRLTLNEIVEFCHRNGIKAHAWINVFYIWSKNKAPRNPNHPFLQDVDHLLSDWSSEEPVLKNLKKKGVEGYFVDPRAFTNKAQIERLLNQLLTQYQFDGIHLDYIRYPGKGVIFSKHLRTLFMKKYFIDPLLFFKEKTFNPEGQSLYRNFLLNELNNFVENFKNVVRQIDESCVVTMAVKPDIDRAKFEYYQDWVNWLKQGSGDYVLMMNYSPDENVFRKNLLKAEQLIGKNNVVCGIGAYYLDGENLEKRIKLVEALQFKGYALFSFTTLKNKPELLTTIDQRQTIKIQTY